MSANSIEPLDRRGSAGGLDSQSLAIGALTTSAILMIVLLISWVPKPAAAIGQADRAGDYKVLTQEVSNSRELLAVVDAAAKRILYYEYDISRKQLEMIEQIPLDQLPVPPPETPQAPPAQRKRP
jgi:hypothetical protein